MIATANRKTIGDLNTGMIKSTLKSLSVIHNYRQMQKDIQIHISLSLHPFSILNYLILKGNMFDATISLRVLVTSNPLINSKFQNTLLIPKRKLIFVVVVIIEVSSKTHCRWF